MHGHKRQAVLSQRPAGSTARKAHTFVLRHGLSGEPATISLELQSKPGHFLTTHVPVDDSSWNCAQTTTAADCRPGSEKANRFCPASCARWVPSIKRLQPEEAPLAGSAARAAWADTATFRVHLPQGRLPEGSKLLHGDVRSYIISPLSSIVDERYTAYFEWVHPRSFFWRQLRRSGLWTALAAGIVGLLILGCRSGSGNSSQSSAAAVQRQPRVDALNDVNAHIAELNRSLAKARTASRSLATAKRAAVIAAAASVPSPDTARAPAGASQAHLQRLPSAAESMSDEDGYALIEGN
jgi:hypothetical protein